MGTAPHGFDLTFLKILVAPHIKKNHWGDIVSFAPKKSLLGFQQAAK
jgi:hypothetical protein